MISDVPDGQDLGGKAYDAFARIKLLALTAGAPGEQPICDALQEILVICRDMGVKEKLPQLRERFP